MGDRDGRAAPDLAEIGSTLEKAEKAVRTWADKEIAAIEARRDDQVHRLEKAMKVLGLPDHQPSAPQRPSTHKPGRKRRRSKRPATTPAAARERREGMLRYVSEEGRPCSSNEIGSALGLTRDSTQNGLRLLCEEGRLERIGNRSATRYQEPTDRRSTGFVPRAGTVQGRIVQTLEERGWASLEELVQTIGAPRQEIAKQCDLLISEQEIYLTLREGRSVYAIRGAL